MEGYSALRESNTEITQKNFDQHFGYLGTHIFLVGGQKFRSGYLTTLKISFGRQIGYLGLSQCNLLACHPSFFDRDIRGCQTFFYDHYHYGCKNAKSHYFYNLVAQYYLTRVLKNFPPNLANALIIEKSLTAPERLHYGFVTLLIL